MPVATHSADAVEQNHQLAPTRERYQYRKILDSLYDTRAFMPSYGGRPGLAAH
jgi:hypothetical protein